MKCYRTEIRLAHEATGDRPNDLRDIEQLIARHEQPVEYGVMSIDHACEEEPTKGERTMGATAAFTMADAGEADVSMAPQNPAYATELTQAIRAASDLLAARSFPSEHMKTAEQHLLGLLRLQRRLFGVTMPKDEAESSQWSRDDLLKMVGQQQGEIDRLRNDWRKLCAATGSNADVSPDDLATFFERSNGRTKKLEDAICELIEKTDMA